MSKTSSTSRSAEAAKLTDSFLGVRELVRAFDAIVIVESANKLAHSQMHSQRHSQMEEA